MKRFVLILIGALLIVGIMAGVGCGERKKEDG